jgi:hypothetical protein
MGRLKGDDERKDTLQASVQVRAQQVMAQMG